MIFSEILVQKSASIPHVIILTWIEFNITHTTTLPQAKILEIKPTKYNQLDQLLLFK